jgi:hypothetical protein
MTELAELFCATAVSPTPAALPRTNQIVEVLTLRRSERPWDGPVPASFSAVPNKPTLEFDEQPIWAEFVLLRLLERDGWSGAWVKNWGGRAFWRDVRQGIELPPAANALFTQIETRSAAHGAGCWDIFAWRGDDYLS